MAEGVFAILATKIKVERTKTAATYRGCCIVLLKDTNLRNEWKLSLVTDVLPGSKGNFFIFQSLLSPRIGINIYVKN